MILPGRSLISRKIIKGVISETLQPQPCGVDLTLKRLLKWTSAGAVDFDNSLRQAATTTKVSAPDAMDHPAPDQRGLHLPVGSYLVEFNETVSVPLDAMGQIFVRSSLFRSGALLHAGVVDSGYSGVLGALLQVTNPFGL
ncbi:putative dUTPase [Macrophomina phaseolina]|uniref:dUTPase n=1 Tax=Macrophomina phaseolina TaxID=35725 RepID=A0ABQ8GJ05_9PEZI|nr:putative dUTPase [Macrophomina phaseolina]